MQTSYYANLKNIPPGLVPVGISIGLPRWQRFAGRRELRLAPTRAMLKMTADEYDPLFAAQLAALDPAAIAADLGDNAVLLCFERPGERCHRRMVAEWFETSLGIVVPELGIERSRTPSCRDVRDAELLRLLEEEGGRP